MFYHGFENYMTHAFPEDELRPLTCKPLTRDRENPAHVELNDVLGNYSLTLIDSLSTLAILASSDARTDNEPGKALGHFQDGVQQLVELYGDGSEGDRGQGTRGRGFDVDSKVQVFETVIRGLGGLLSAHLFAVGDLPITGYHPSKEEAEYAKTWLKDEAAAAKTGVQGIVWSNGLAYDGQLLRLALDLGKRLLPAFYSPTGIPYPRVNLRYGIPFYGNSILNANLDEDEQCAINKPSSVEITETCSAGAGSLTLEFTVLSRLTGDARFEELGKRAFWAIWDRRSEIGLIGAGIDAETGEWIGPYTGVGAGIDSFFEYALKSYILLSGQEHPHFVLPTTEDDPNDLFEPLIDDDNSAMAFLQTWEEAHAAISRHLSRGYNYQHPHFIQADLYTGATRALWIDSLSAYYPGLLTLSGDLDEAVENHILTAAVWSRFSALPERWNVASGGVEGGLGWWGGRPEFIESTYYLYRATQDPWFLYTGEMVLRDIKRRCYTKCGWAGLQDVRTGEQNNRMESFFLGETAKYLYLLFEPAHPLNHLDASFVFTTEGHPLIIPRGRPSSNFKKSPASEFTSMSQDSGTCQVPPRPLPFSISPIAARGDMYHAASLARLHLMPTRDQIDSPLLEYAHDHPSITLSDIVSPSNYTYFPWTMPPDLVPYDASCKPMQSKPTFDLSFPSSTNVILGHGGLQRIKDGILINSLGGLRISMVLDVEMMQGSVHVGDAYRIQTISNFPLGKDEKVFLARDTLAAISPTDPNFTTVRDPMIFDLVVDIDMPTEAVNSSSPLTTNNNGPSRETDEDGDGSTNLADTYTQAASAMKSAINSFLDQLSTLLVDPSSTSSIRQIATQHFYKGDIYTSSPRQKFTSPQASDSEGGSQSLPRLYIPAITPTGVGAAPIPDFEEAPPPTSPKFSTTPLSWSTVYMADQLCDTKLPLSIVRKHQVVVLKRGGCSFSDKLANFPAVKPAGRPGKDGEGLQLVIVVSDDEDEQGFPLWAPNQRAENNDGQAGNTGDEHENTRPPSDSSSFSTGSSQDRDSTMAMTSGPSYLNPPAMRPLLDEPQKTSAGLSRHHPLSMVLVGGGHETYELLRQAKGLGVKRRYEIRTQGTLISNLVVV